MCPIIQQLYDAWKDSDMTIKELSRQSEISTASCYRYIHGQQIPASDKLARLCTVLGYDLIIVQNRPKKD